VRNLSDVGFILIPRKDSPFEARGTPDDGNEE